MAASGDWLSVGEAAQLLGVSIPTLRRWDRSGKLEPARHPLTNHRVYARSAIEAVLRELRGPAPSAIARASEAIPRPSSSFVGRDAELACLLERIRSGGALISLVGPGGVGKTRLALELLKRVVGERKLAGWFCDLSSARCADEIVTAVAATVGAELPTLAAIDERARRVGAWLAANSPALIVLDNFEQVVESGAALVARWCATASGLRVLVTSRERLRVRDETLLEVGSLELEPALALFADRVEAALSARSDPKRERELIADLVRRLDGLPLAIELCAARYPALGARGLCAELGRRLDLLARGARDAPSRHATMRATLDWSWDLLSEHEQRALRQSAVFAGGFELSAAERVIEVAPRSESAHELLESLRDKSLLGARHSERGVRFALSELCREYARERLDQAGEGARAERRHAAYYAERARSWVALPAERVIEPPPELVVERANLIAAHARALASDPEGALTIALALERVLAVRDPIDLTLALLESSLAACASTEVDRMLLATALVALGRYLQERGSLETSIETLERALSLVRAAAQRAAEAHVLSLLGVAEIQLGRRESALAHLECAVEIARAQPDDPGRRYTFAHYASVCHEAGLLERADAAYREAMAIALAHGDRTFAARMNARLGRVAVDRGRPDEAAERLSAALDELASDRYLGFVLVHRACMARELDQLDRARSDFARARTLLGELGMLAPSALVRGYHASVLADLGRDEAADSELAQARRDLSSLDDSILSLTLGLFEAHSELLRFRRARRAGDDAAATRALSAIREKMNTAAPLVERDKDVRFAARMLERMLDACERDGDAALPCDSALVAARDGSFFTPVDGERVDLSPRAPLRRLLAELVQTRVASTGTARSTSELVRAGWPGETIQHRAAAQRVYSAIAELKALGLGALRSGDGGYLLDPLVPLRLET